MPAQTAREHPRRLEADRFIRSRKQGQGKVQTKGQDTGFICES